MTQEIEADQPATLTDTFLGELVRELDHEDIVAIMLGGSHARGEATRYSDVDLACFWREGVKPPPKRLFYRAGRLISVKNTTVAEIRAGLTRPEAALLFVSGTRRALLDKDGSLERLLEEIEAFRWEDLRAESEQNINKWMMLKAEDVQKILKEFQQKNDPGLAYGRMKLMAEMTLLVSLYYGVLIKSDSTYYQQVEEAAGEDSAWTYAHRVAAGLEEGPAGIKPLRAQAIAAVCLYRETFALVRPILQADVLAVVEQVVEVVKEAAHALPFTTRERQWLLNYMEQRDRGNEKEEQS